MMSGAEERGEHGSAAPCDGCALVGRRDFFRDAGALAAGILIALGATPALASATPFELVSALGGGREDRSYAIPAKDGTQIDKDTQTIITRWSGSVYVFSLACPHQNTAVRWYDKDNMFECPKHHSRYQPNGEYVKDSGRATRGLDRFAVRKDGSNVVVNLDKLYQQDEDEALWKAAFIAV
jgi:Rieske Fe-S protein